ncbi:unnamed protein product [Orchesella dallaii]|uniref:Mediator of RNA polymerase II transcription subunit 19 n=1 Tax=Orchesella dallaii TaxID=48710 RepID=A0ABP1R649_9HEXA
MSEQFRKVEQYSPKSSPRGSRSPVVPRQDSTGTLKATISLGKNPSIVHTGPFYLIKEPPTESDLTGATNLMAHYGLEHSYNKSSGRKVRDTLSSFLPNLPGQIDSPGHLDNSSLRSVIDKPPIGGKELLPLSSMQLSGFRLHPGALPEQYRLMNQVPQKKKHKHKKHKHKPGDTPSHQESTTTSDVASSAEKKHKKQKRHDDDKERKKRKKEKKKKKQKHSPEHPSGSSHMDM